MLYKILNVVLDIVTESLYIYTHYTIRLYAIWLFPYPYGFCNPVWIHGMTINDMIWYGCT
jgi:hypothetical protein